MFTEGQGRAASVVFLGALIVWCTAVAAEDKSWIGQVKSTISPGKEEFIVGEPISLKVHVLNLNRETIYVWDRDGRYFEFAGEGPDGNRMRDLTETQISRWSSPVAVADGADFNDVTFVNGYLDFAGPGTYTVRYRGYLYLQRQPKLGEDPNTYVMRVSAQIGVRLRQAPAQELEAVLKDYLSLLESENDRLQRQGARALAVSEPNLAVRLLKGSLTSADGGYPLHSSWVMWTLAKIGTDEAIEVLVDSAQHGGHRMVRTDAIEEVGRFGISSAVGTLKGLLSDGDARIRAGGGDSAGTSRRRGVRGGG